MMNKKTILGIIEYCSFALAGVLALIVNYIVTRSDAGIMFAVATIIGIVLIFAGVIILYVRDNVGEKLPLLIASIITFSLSAVANAICSIFVLRSNVGVAYFVLMIIAGVLTGGGVALHYWRKKL